MKKRCSIITIICLILVIICLIATLVIKCLDKIDTKTATNEENPIYISLDSDIVKKMYRILGLSEKFYYIEHSYITVKDISNNDIQNIAYFYSAKDKMINYDDVISHGKLLIGGELSKSDMDNSVKEVFGNISYTPSDFDGKEFGIYTPICEYNAEDNKYYHKVGYGGGGNFPRSIRGVISLAEYADRYELTEKFLFMVPKPLIKVNDNYSISTAYIININDGPSYFSNKLGEYKAFDDKSYVSFAPTYDEFISGVEIKSMYVGETYDEYDQKEAKTNQEILSKYYDEAMEYKHTFMKNEDGSFYWVKSEIVE